MRDVPPNGRIHYRFRQRGSGYDRSIVEPGTTLKQVEYIHFNPVRRKLCRRPEDWYGSSAGDYSEEQGDPLSIDRESLRRLRARGL